MARRVNEVMAGEWLAVVVCLRSLVPEVRVSVVWQGQIPNRF